MLLAAAAIVSIVAVTALIIGDPADRSSVRTTADETPLADASEPSTTDTASGQTTTTPVHITQSTGPSQPVAEADRDGVIPELAAFPASVRADVRAAIDADEGTWAISRASHLDVPMKDCTLGDPDGAYGTERICTAEYGEILLIDDQGAIVRAYPMPGIPPTWIYATDDAIYGGRIGDGGLPQSTIFQIDRATLHADIILFPYRAVDGSVLGNELPGWRRATPDAATAFEENRLVDYRPDAQGTQATTTGGTTTIDLPAIEALFP